MDIYFHSMNSVIQNEMELKLSTELTVQKFSYKGSWPYE